jgi:hypothetical protein
MMKVTLIMIAILLLSGCGAASSRQNTDNPNSARSSAQSAKADEPGYEVKIMRKGAEFASYSHSGPRAVALYDGQSFMMFFASNDNKDVLTVAIQGVQEGAYSLPADNGAPKQGEARLDFIDEKELLVLIPDKGELKLEKFTEKQCSGSFTGTGIDIKGVPFSIEGKFSNLTVKDVEEK